MQYWIHQLKGKEERHNALVHGLLGVEEEEEDVEDEDGAAKDGERSGHCTSLGTA